MWVVIDCACPVRGWHRKSGNQTQSLAVPCEAYCRQLQHYIDVRKVIDDFRVDVKAQVNRLEGGAKADLQRKHASLLAFDYEAAARLKAWDSLDQIIKVCPVTDHVLNRRT